MRRLLLAGLAVVAIGLGWAVAQTTQVVQTLTGGEAWQVGSGPAGPGFYTTTKAMRGAYTYAAIPTGTTITQTISPNVDAVIVTGAVTTLNLSMPSAPFDQQTVIIACPGGTVTTLNLSVGAATSPSTFAGVGNVTGGSNTASTCSNTVATSLSVTYTASANAASLGGGVTWNRIR